jgi:hypothetical protein
MVNGHQTPHLPLSISLKSGSQLRFVIHNEWTVDSNRFIRIGAGKHQNLGGVWTRHTPTGNSTRDRSRPRLAYPGIHAIAGPRISWLRDRARINVDIPIDPFPLQTEWRIEDLPRLVKHANSVYKIANARHDSNGSFYTTTAAKRRLGDLSSPPTFQEPRGPAQIDAAVVDLALELPVYGQIRIANEVLKRHTLKDSPQGVLNRPGFYGGSNS